MFMNNVKDRVIVIALLIICCSSFTYAENFVSIPPQDSLVVVTSSTPFGKRAGNGFVIGDGHLVSEEAGRQALGRSRLDVGV